MKWAYAIRRCCRNCQAIFFLIPNKVKIILFRKQKNLTQFAFAKGLFLLTRS
jgi:hypothetical protein